MGSRVQDEHFKTIDRQELSELIKRLQYALDHDLAIDNADVLLLIQAIQTLDALQSRMEDQDITLRELKKMIGLLPASERRPSSKEAHSETKAKLQKKRKSTKGSKLRTPRKPQVIEHHMLEDVSKGDSCEECGIGKYYRFEPATLLRITGQSPLVSTKHIMEQMRCNACGYVVTAAVPDKVTQDGKPSQMFGFSARAVLVISKYFCGTPFFRNDSVQQLLGEPVTASTQFDQCEYVANNLSPIFKALQHIAGQADFIYIDDTPHKILNATAVEKPVRGTDRTRLRTGVNASGLIAKKTDGYMVLLFNTSIGHAGEHADEILRSRENGLGPPVVMSDALSCNKVFATPVIPLRCNVHARREFFKLESTYPDDVEPILNQYGKIWDHDDHCAEKQLLPNKRLEYHKEHSLPIMAWIQQECEAVLGAEDAELNGRFAGACRYFLNHYEGLTGFCTHEGAGIDNNVSERLLQLIARGRKNSFFYKTGNGAAISDVLTSVLATCDAHDVNAFQYLIWVQQHKELVRSVPMQCLPWNYSQHLPQDQVA